MSFFGNLSSLFSGEAVTRPQAGKVVKKGEPTTKKIEVTPIRPTKNAQPVQQKQVVIQQPAKPAAVPAATKADIDAVLREAQAKAREIIVEAKDEALAVKGRAEQDIRIKERQIEEQQRNLDRKLDKIDFRLTQLDERESQVEKFKTETEKIQAELVEQRARIIDKLEKVSGLTTDEAKDELFARLERKLSQEMAQFIRQKEEQARNEADEVVKEILVDAMKHGATDYVSEYTISTVALPSEEIKGKIIGKAGRNIHTFEKVTGVDVDLDTSPTEVRLSCFDSVRREVARISLERLIKDGRIQPTRIEEVVKKVESELDKVMFEAGKNLCHEVGVYNLPTELMRMLGRFKYRFSYGQNLIGHTLEETKIGIKLAHELGANANIVKLGCLLHDIGKVSTDEEGSHVDLGIKIAKKYGMPQAVVDCIAQHHEDEPFSGPEQMIVYIADAISGARPGARYENYEEYVERLQKLEEIATKYEGVKLAYAIQAGREVRVLLEPEKTKDNDVTVLAVKIKDEIQQSLTYPGTVTVTVMRETRSQSVAT